MNRRVLLVDDQLEKLGALTQWLRQSYELETATSAEDALWRVRTEGPFAVVVTDYQMPGESGIGLLAHLREESPDTVRVLMTGHADLDVAREATNRGEVFRFLEKPLPLDMLRAVLDEGLERHAARCAEADLLRDLQDTQRSVARIAHSLEEDLEETTPLDAITELAARCATAVSMEELAGAAVDAGAQLLPGRGMRIALHTGRRKEDAASLRRGPRIAAPVHREVVCGSDGELGHFLVGGLHGAELSEEERRIVKAVASIAGVSIQNLVRRRQRDDAQHAVIFAMARLAEARDNETGKHLERVSNYCALAAEGLRHEAEFAHVIDDLFIEDIIRSAPLHDVGKVGIPDAILLKPGKLDPSEWAIMQTHPQIGADILRRVIDRSSDPGFLLMALDIAWCHHETWAGTGYPRGLTGEEIPLAARILSVADCYDALTTVRPYKKPWTHVAALEYLREESGKRFDPRVVAAFLENRERADQVRVRLADPD